MRRAELSEISQEISENSQEGNATKKKGPDSAPTLPGHGSTSPKGNPNMETDTTAAGARQVLDYRDLESELHNAVNMSEIACDMIEAVQGGSRKRDDGCLCLSNEDVRLISFAVYHANDLTRAVMKKWDAVHDSAVAAGKAGAA